MSLSLLVCPYIVRNLIVEVDMFAIYDLFSSQNISLTVVYQLFLYSIFSGYKCTQSLCHLVVSIVV